MSSAPASTGNLDVAVLVHGPVHRLAATLEHLRAAGRRDALVVVPWPAPPGWEVVVARHPGARVVRCAGVGVSPLANAALSAASAHAVLFVRAGDRPSRALLIGHAAAHAAHPTAGAVVGAIRSAWGAPGDGVSGAWVGPVPLSDAPLPCRHLSVNRAMALVARGFDERLADLDVSAGDLVARMRREPVDVVVRPDLELDVPIADAGTALHAGRSAEVQSLLHTLDGTPMPLAGPRWSRVTLRWAEPLLWLAARLSRNPGRAEQLARRAAFARGRGTVPAPPAPLWRGGPPGPMPEQRPAVAVVLPFAGSREAALRVLADLRGLELRPGDEVVVADNSRTPVVPTDQGIGVVRADDWFSSYAARKAAVAATTAPWLLFIDADCTPCPWILDAFFAPEPEPGDGAIAGAVISHPAGRTFAERHSRMVGVLDQAHFLSLGNRPFAVTANLLVRREALDGVGGFAQGIRSGGDADLCWRLGDAGWTIGWRARAAVLHRDRTSVADLLRQYRRYGAGVRWLATRHDGVDEPRLPEARALSEPALDLVAGRFALALSRLTTLLTRNAARGAHAEANRAERGPGSASS